MQNGAPPANDGSVWKAAGPGHRRALPEARTGAGAAANSCYNSWRSEHARGFFGARVVRWYVTLGRWVLGVHVPGHRCAQAKKLGSNFLKLAGFFLVDENNPPTRSCYRTVGEMIDTEIIGVTLWAIWSGYINAINFEHEQPCKPRHRRSTYYCEHSFTKLPPTWSP
jgi:hypothetical protein